MAAHHSRCVCVFVDAGVTQLKVLNFTVHCKLAVCEMKDFIENRKALKAKESS